MVVSVRVLWFDVATGGMEQLGRRKVVYNAGVAYGEFIPQIIITITCSSSVYALFMPFLTLNHCLERIILFINSGY